MVSRRHLLLHLLRGKSLGCVACLTSLALTLTSSVVSAVGEWTARSAWLQRTEWLLSVCVCVALTQTGLLPGCHGTLWRVPFRGVRYLGHGMPCDNLCEV